MGSKQTAVEWLIDKLEKHYVHYDLKNTVVFEQAKAMHKEEIIESYCQGCLDMNNDDTIFPRETSQQYYNETFNK